MTSTSVFQAGGCPVIEGEKWSATKWMRVGPFTGFDFQNRRMCAQFSSKLSKISCRTSQFYCFQSLMLLFKICLHASFDWQLKIKRVHLLSRALHNWTSGFQPGRQEIFCDIQWFCLRMRLWPIIEKLIFHIHRNYFTA